jgi:uncharacterized membrane protein
MLAHLMSLWDKFRDSLWPLPLAMIAAGAGLAVLALEMKAPALSELAWLYHGDAEQAPAFASSLVSAMITLSALALSITMVVLTLAAQQLGPRLIHIFMRDWRTQASIGLFLGTSVYLLAVLRSLEGDGGDAPNLAITGGTVLVVASIIVLLLFVHSLARSIVADHVIARVGRGLDAAIRAAFGEKNGDSQAPPRRGEPIVLGRCGYVQRIDYQALARAARGCDGHIILAHRPGAHVIAGEVDAWVCGAEFKPLKKAVERYVVLAPERSEGQDPEWSARQLVEVALRALSTGINDEFTAIAVVDRLSVSLAILAQCGRGQRVWRDKDGVARVFAQTPTFSSLLDAAFDQIRESGGAKRRILLRLAENLGKLARLAADDDRAAIRAHLERVAAAARATDPHDGADIDAALARAHAELDAARGDVDHSHGIPEGRRQSADQRA